jgi:hypothetical protein
LHGDLRAMSNSEIMFWPFITDGWVKNHYQQNFKVSYPKIQDLISHSHTEMLYWIFIVFLSYHLCLYQNRSGKLEIFVLYFQEQNWKAHKTFFLNQRILYLSNSEIQVYWTANRYLLSTYYMFCVPRSGNIKRRHNLAKQIGLTTYVSKQSTSQFSDHNH